MKTLTLFGKSLILLIILVSMFSCKEIAHDPDFRKNRFYFSYKGRPEQVITYKEMALMLHQYRNTREGVLKKALGFEDTHTNWIQIDSLKKYLAFIEKTSRDNDVKITGINILSAAYPNTSIYGKEKNYQTLILNPTTLKGNDPKVSFDPLYSEKGKPAYLEDLLMPYFSELDSLDLDDENDIRKFIISMSTSANLDNQPSSALNRTIGTPPY